MIDINCHILPQVDDGSSHYTESLIMAKQAMDEGIHTIIATPHHQKGRFPNTKDEIIAKTDELIEYFRRENVHLNVLPGQESHIDGNLIKDYDAGEIMTLGGKSKYTLIELPTDHVPGYTNQLFYELQLKGLTPIIAHPEHNRELIKSPGKLYSLIKNGATAQLTARSIMGDKGKKIQRFAHELIEANLVHFIASGAHFTKRNAFRLAEAMNLVHKKYGADKFKYFLTNADYVVQGKDIYKEVPERIKKKKFFGIY